MKKSFYFILVILLSSIFFQGCMTTWPIMDDLDHYKKWDTYEKTSDIEWLINNIKQNNDTQITENNDINDEWKIDIEQINEIEQNKQDNNGQDNENTKNSIS